MILFYYMLRLDKFSILISLCFLLFFFFFQRRVFPAMLKEALTLTVRFKYLFILFAYFGCAKF